MDTLTLDRASTIAEAPARFTIERGISIPPRQHGPRPEALYPFAAMRVGDSFAVTTANYNARPGGRRPIVTRIQTTLHNCARAYTRKKDPSAKFTVRKIDDSTVRIWRVA